MNLSPNGASGAGHRLWRADLDRFLRQSDGSRRRQHGCQQTGQGALHVSPPFIGESSLRSVRRLLGMTTGSTGGSSLPAGSFHTPSACRPERPRGTDKPSSIITPNTGLWASGTRRLSRLRLPWRRPRRRAPADRAAPAVALRRTSTAEAACALQSTRMQDGRPSGSNVTSSAHRTSVAMLHDLRALYAASRASVTPRRASGDAAVLGCWQQLAAGTASPRDGFVLSL